MPSQDDHANQERQGEKSEEDGNQAEPPVIAWLWSARRRAPSRHGLVGAHLHGRWAPSSSGLKKVSKLMLTDGPSCLRKG